MTTFENAKVGDNVWCLSNNKWLTIIDIRKEDFYPIKTELNSYTIKGEIIVNKGRALFWDKVVITPPEKSMPKLEVDTKVLVWDNEKKIKLHRHFSHFEKDGKIVTFAEGRTSWSQECMSVVDWEYWELPKDKQ